MKSKSMIRVLFLIAALYDGVLGVAFLFGSGGIFDWLGVTPPNHPGYAQFPAAILLIFTLMFLAVAMNPVKNRGLIPYGMLLKVAYCSVVFFHWFTSGIPGMWKPFALLDVGFFFLFAWALVALRGNDTAR
jgi:hypothetical protein